MTPEKEKLLKLFEEAIDGIARGIGALGEASSLAALAMLDLAGATTKGLKRWCPTCRHSYFAKCCDGWVGWGPRPQCDALSGPCACGAWHEKTRHHGAVRAAPQKRKRKR